MKELGRKFKVKALTLIEAAKLRNENIKSMLKSTADRIQFMIAEKIDLIKRRREQYEDMQNMNSSIDEVAQLKFVENDREENNSKWHRNEAEEKEKVVKQFEQDNVWFIDKRSWNMIKKEGVPVMIEDINLCTRNYKAVKLILRKGIRISYSSMLKLRKFVQFSVVDSIDQGRVNKIYFQLLKNMGMFNRFVKLEEWLFGRKWKDKCVKKVNYKHFMGNNNNKMTINSEKSGFMAVIIPNNINFEIVKKLEVAKISKAISYLKWTRNRFKIKKSEVKLADILELNLQEQSFGCQKDENKLII
jgi:hypothetical protein